MEIKIANQLNGLKAGFVYAHPDDETFMSAAVIRQIADTGGNPVLLVATRGDAGFKNGDYTNASREELGVIREQEMAEAAQVLGLTVVEHLGYPDGKLGEADDRELVLQIEVFLQKHEVEAVFTFPLDGGNGHPDHIAISHAATAAVRGGKCPSVRALYYGYFNKGGELQEPELIVETAPYWPFKAAALRAHDSQKHSINRHFGSLDQPREDRRYEMFVAAWKA
ncbi:PIG-L deacetylase family protein [Paenibacillus mendelii]|uniref:PIG-L deacetylase family protein n=1 Tax=Paenibacillus mendelii TaxID=206163 RepID=A0ABV6J8M4_9BACL|nr:PIG-L family deacetylase [Paenibacillus mendelii]MCQ6559471.1 PIG-L family deacetylase [Paenibacillus mendelii]